MKLIFVFGLTLMLILTARGGTAANNGSIGGSTFTLTVNGAAAVTIDQSSGTSLLGSAVVGETQTYTFYFGDPANGRAASIVFFGIEPAAGTYEITPTDPVANPNGVSGLYIESTPSMRAFTATAGTLTLEGDRSGFSGSFEYTAVDGVTGDAGETVTITGTFSGLPLTETAAN